MDNIFSSVVLCFKLLNTVVSSKFQKSLSKPWVGADSNQRVAAIQEKATLELKRIMKIYFKNLDRTNADGYLESLLEHKKISVRKSDKKVIVSNFGVDEYSLVRDLICRESSRYQVFGKLASDKFECHELLNEIINYLLIKDSVENGTGIKTLDSVISTLLLSKPISFFSEGYINDLFISDRIALHSSSDGSKFIRSYRGKISTCIVEEVDANNSDQYEYFKVA